MTLSKKNSISISNHLIPRNFKIVDYKVNIGPCNFDKLTFDYDARGDAVISAYKF